MSEFLRRMLNVMASAAQNGQATRRSTYLEWTPRYIKTVGGGFSTSVGRATKWVAPVWRNNIGGRVRITNGTTAEPELLTHNEKRVADLLAQAYNLYSTQVVGDGPSRQYDLMEFAAHIHDLQHAVMAQAAARAYPELYRLAGETL